MGSFANTLFMIMLGWIEAAVSAIWYSFSNEGGNAFLQWLGNSWIYIALFLCAAGLIIDLSIYIVRWRPYLIWKKVFRGRNHVREKEDDQRDYDEKQAEEQFSRRMMPDTGSEKERLFEAREQVPDLSAWNEPETQTSVQEQVSDAGNLVTAAGYVVPKDSPYRRPDNKASNEPETAEGRTDTEAKKETRTVSSRHRRRIIVSDLFGDPEEDLIDIEAPQHVIDRHQAYHEPVYPSGWKKEDRANDTSV